MLIFVVLLNTAQVAPQQHADPPGIAYQDTVAMLIVMVRFQDDYWGDCGEWWCHLQHWPHADWGVTGEEIPRTRLPYWPATFLEKTPEDVREENLSFADSSMSAYFYWQSRLGSGGPHILYGDVWPEVYVTERPNRAYYNRRDSMGVEVRQNSGFGVLTKEMLDNLVHEGLDLGNYDHDRDGVVDHIMMIFRRDSLYRQQGWAVLNGVYKASGTPDLDNDRRPDSLNYWSPSRRDSVLVDYRYSGSQIFTDWPKRILIIHEYGHRLLDFPGHINVLQVGEVPHGERAPCGYARMCGIPATYDEASATLSVYERRKMGWLEPTVLRSDDGDREGVEVRDLYTAGDAVLIPLTEGAAGDTLEIANRQRIGFFDQHRRTSSLHPDYDWVYHGLAANGLHVAVTSGSPNATGPGQRYRYGFLPADGEYRHQSQCTGAAEGCNGPWVYEGDLFDPEGQNQLTPWTRPNTSGYIEYPSTGVPPQWFALDAIRYTGDTDSTMAFDFVADVRRKPHYMAEEAHWPVFREDSWIGPESDGLVFGAAVIQSGNTLYIGADTTAVSKTGFETLGPVHIVFEEGLNVEEGAFVVIGSEATVHVERGRFGGGGIIAILEGADVTLSPGVDADPSTWMRLESTTQPSED
ncbi:MAG: hypothetical protein R3284_00605 [Rubricoccaceae bacterium]|nr:hypothetical protein [Rubricoccaceae bacterium]